MLTSEPGEAIGFRSIVEQARFFSVVLLKFEASNDENVWNELLDSLQTPLEQAYLTY